ncbi:MAG: branched-chain amino acid ABC transporter permease [Chloroflexota bacterium]|nr:hypothetical protein [Chloroflexota bacterium]NOG63316.1 hypothetical protein [Chloroflexota bacterium]GIK64576.1 MAG: branched-chain amino acid ABC transporter permease [Chloroflexota bacterium]
MDNTIKRRPTFKIDKNLLWGGIAIAFVVFLLILTALDVNDGKRFSQIVAGGLYQGMLIFMVAAGLSIVFGLMDVLNFAQGSLFMIGAYVGVEVLSGLSNDTKTNAALLSIHVVTFTPIAVTLLVEIGTWLFYRFMSRQSGGVRPSGHLLAKLTTAALVGAPLGVLLGNTVANDLGSSADLIRVIGAVVVTALTWVDIARDPLLFSIKWLFNEISTRFQRGLAIIQGHQALPVEALKYRPSPLPENGVPIIQLVSAVLLSTSLGILFNSTEATTLRFGIAATAAVFAGALAGVVMETVFIRPTYVRPFFQIVLTFGIALVVREVIIYKYGVAAKGTLAAHLPSTLRGTFPPAFLQDVFPNLETSISNYWIFMIMMGLLMMIGVQVLLMRSRIGIIIRAGVQDSEMVEALGVNVRLVFTAVFGLGAGIAAFGGIISAGFISINPVMGDLYLLQAIAVVIIGGLGSYAGTSIAAVVVGITRSVAEYFAGKQFNSTGLAPVAVLVLLCLILLVKPSGLFGKEH